MGPQPARYVPSAQALLAAMSEAVYVVDRQRRVTYWNPAAERLTGYPADQVVGRCCRDGILNHVDHEGTSLCKSRCPLLATIGDGQPHDMLAFLHHRDGHRVPVAAGVVDPVLRFYAADLGNSHENDPSPDPGADRGSPGTGCGGP